MRKSFLKSVSCLTNAKNRKTVQGSMCFAKAIPTPPFNSNLIKVYLLDTNIAMFELGSKNSFLLCLLVKNMSAVYSADRCDFSIVNSSYLGTCSGPHGS